MISAGVELTSVALIYIPNGAITTASSFPHVFTGRLVSVLSDSSPEQLGH